MYAVKKVYWKIFPCVKKLDYRKSFEGSLNSVTI